MQAILPRGLNREKAASLTASIVVNLAMIVAFASIANIDGKKIKEGASLVVVGLSGSGNDKKPAEAEPPASLPAPPPSAKAAVASTMAQAVQKEPDQQKIELLQPVQQASDRLDTPAAEPPAENRPAPDQMREAAEQQRRAQEAAKARAEPAQNEAKAAASQRAAASGTTHGASSGYKSQIIQHLRRFSQQKQVGGGSTFVRFTITDDGSAINIGIMRSSGSAAFDREALQTVRRASPFPKPPPGEGGTINFEFTGR